ncbi:hypothetical protein ABPG72_020832, partial [Tetrahymena utriculariae]
MSDQARKYIGKVEEEIIKDFLLKSEQRYDKVLEKRKLFQVVQADSEKRKRRIAIKIAKQKIVRQNLADLCVQKKNSKVSQMKRDQLHILKISEKIQDDDSNLASIKTQFSDSIPILSQQLIIIQLKNNAQLDNSITNFNQKRPAFNHIYFMVYQLITCLLLQIDKRILNREIKSQSTFFNKQKKQLMKAAYGLSNILSKKASSLEKYGLRIIEKIQDNSNSAIIEIYSQERNKTSTLEQNKLNINQIYTMVSKVFGILILLKDKDTKSSKLEEIKIQLNRSKTQLMK